MAIKIEDQSGVKLPRGVEAHVDKLLSSVPREHLRGIDRIRLVDSIVDPRLRNVPTRSDLPGLYHPRQGQQSAWLEVAVGVLLAKPKPYLKRIMPRLSFKGNLAAVIFSLIGQHYHLTLKHSVKKSQIEPAVRTYTETQLRRWNQQQHSIRARLFKPLQPTLERWAKRLQKRAAKERKRKQQSA